MSYVYNNEGIRTSKTVNNVTTKYYLKGNKIVFEDRNSSVLYYIYNNDELIGFRYSGNTYHYHKNLFGDVIGIYNSNNEEIVQYEYDSWGALISTIDNSNINLSTINPFRYRSYYYDEESKLYYLNSRYYNPEFGRFINADFLILSNDYNSCNLYTYCNNNVIMRVDYSGLFSFWDVLDVAGFVKSLVDVIEEPTVENCVWLALDTVSLVPLLPSVGVVDDSVDIIKRTNDISNTKYVKETGDNVWKIGDDINKLTKSGNYPSWNTVKRRYWKNEAFYNSVNYNSYDLLRMKDGKPPMVLDVFGNAYPMELHHINGRKIPDPHNINNLEPLTPWQHADKDPYRHFKK